MVTWLEDQQLWMQNGGDPDEFEYAYYAQILGGTRAGKTITAPSPYGTLTITGAADRPFVYGCARDCLALAKAYVYKKLNLQLPTPADNTGKALAIWRETESADGTLVERYLRSRGLTAQVPPCLRFHRELWHGRRRGTPWPGMVAIVTALNGAEVAIHRTWLAQDGNGKAPFDKPRLSLGPITNGLIRLTPLAEELGVGEGIENAMAYTQLTGVPAWSALNAVNLEMVRLPAEVRVVVLLADHKRPDDPGLAVCRRTAQRLLTEGRRVRIATPPLGKDFNAIVQDQMK